ncbi:MAG: glycosyl hydrolase family 30 [Chryseobacterium sp.]|nr:MAG: glycosyl hydrolase family 30 [Chryseobacterium sp.]
MKPTLKLLFFTLMLSTSVFNIRAQSSWKLITSTNQQPWQNQKSIQSQVYDPTLACDIVVEPKKQLQRIDGWGGCFNELGWKSLLTITPEKRAEVINNLFGANGLNFNIGRIPVGASDYALNWYSFNEVANDFSMSKFSIQRDKELMIPYIKAALNANPALSFWASPWSPPSWMKVNNHYASIPSKFNDLPESRSVKSLTEQFILKPAYLQSYALYLSKFIQAYQTEGIPVSAIHVQNEPFHHATFPGCVWSAKSLGVFIADYLHPEFKKKSITTSIWYGTINNGSLDGYQDALSNPKVSAIIKGVGVQWAGKNALKDLKVKYPNLKFMQTESECGNGSFDWSAAEYTFGLIKSYFDNGVSSYTYWNMVLDHTGTSTWGWKQNALITVNPTTKEVVYTPEYYLFKHLSYFVEAGSYKINQQGPYQQALAFKNPQGRTILFIHNPYDYVNTVVVKIENETIRVTLQAKSFNTLYSAD